MRIALEIGLLGAVFSCAGTGCGARSSSSGEAEADAAPTQPWWYADAGPDADPELVCTGLPAWTAADTRSEEELVRVLNEAREGSHDCDGQIVPPTAAVPLDASLRCAAREATLSIETTGDWSPVPHDENGVNLVSKWGYAVGCVYDLASQAATAEAAVEEWLSPERDGGDRCSTMLLDWTECGTGARGGIWVAIFAVP